MSESTKKYTKEGVTVVWKPELCTHSARCFKGMPEVFDPRRRPWISMEDANTADIIKQVGECPSGALSISSDQVSESENMSFDTEVTRIEVSSKGPLLITGSCLVVEENGNETLKEGKFALCRCGGSSKKPFCDGTHRKLDVL